MEIYRNRVSGQEITTPCELVGENWERVESNDSTPAPVQPVKKPAAAKTGKGGAKNDKGAVRNGK